MTVLDSAGRAVKGVIPDEDEWLVHALFFWLADERTRRLLIRKGRATPHGIAVLGGLLDAHLGKRAKVDLKLVRKEMLNILEDRSARISIARKTLIDQLENAERDPMGPLPDTSHAIRTQLQDLRVELERRAESERLILRPW